MTTDFKKWQGEETVFYQTIVRPVGIPLEEQAQCIRLEHWQGPAVRTDKLAFSFIHTHTHKITYSHKNADFVSDGLISFHSFQDVAATNAKISHSLITHMCPY